MLERVRQRLGHGVLDPVDPDGAQQATTESRLDTGNERLETLLIDHATTSLTQQETIEMPTRATRSPAEGRIILTHAWIDVASVAHEEPNVHRVIPAHVDEHAREERLEGLHPDHATNFGLILPTEITNDAT
jgi:hypothetical protein